ncbi:MAG TPA: response regulator transcription factor [Acidimicrobiales bacterium]|nr:response regulator transcription factor [Acidimicrobiales bacterium]
MSAVQTMLVDDHTVLREGLRRSLEAAGLDVVAEVGDGLQVLAAARETHPNVVLMDLSLPGQDGLVATRELKEYMPELPVIILTMFADEQTVREAYAAGADGYLLKDCSTAEMVSTVTSVVHDRREPGNGALKSFIQTRNKVSSNHGLTRREVEVLQVLANGSSTTDLAKKLYISAKTAKNHLAHIYSKLGATSRTEAVAKAVRLGIVRIG